MKRLIQKTYSVDKIKQTYPFAYEKWTRKEEEQLIVEFGSGLHLSEIANLHGRKTGAIKSRLRKLNLID